MKSTNYLVITSNYWGTQFSQAGNCYDYWWYNRTTTTFDIFIDVNEYRSIKGYLVIGPY